MYSGRDLARQVAYVAAVIESTLPGLAAMPDAAASQFETGLAELRALPMVADAVLGWTVHKAHAVR